MTKYRRTTSLNHRLHIKMDDTSPLPPAVIRAPPSCAGDVILDQYLGSTDWGETDNRGY